MTEQIMKILPAKIGLEFNALYPDESRYVRHGYNQAIDECATAIEKANLVRCPTEEEIADLIWKCHEDNMKLKFGLRKNAVEMDSVIAKALLALLRGEK